MEGSRRDPDLEFAPSMNGVLIGLSVDVKDALSLVMRVQSSELKRSVDPCLQLLLLPP